MKKGDSIRIFEGQGDPFRGPARGHIAALLVCGAKLYGTKPLVDFIEDKSQGEIERTHRWVFEADTMLDFKPSFAAEQIPLQELVRRFQSDEWCAANPDHPIAYMRCLFDQLAIMDERRKSWKPAILMRNGDDTAILGPNMTEEEKQEAIAKLAAAK